jgi:hypothetical protein
VLHNISYLVILILNGAHNYIAKYKKKKKENRISMQSAFLLPGNRIHHGHLDLQPGDQPLRSSNKGRPAESIPGDITFGLLIVLLSQQGDKSSDCRECNTHLSYTPVL